MPTMLAVPASFGCTRDSVNGWPTCNCTSLSVKRAMRIFGPWRSPMMATKRPCWAAMSRTNFARARWSSALPCEKFKRATSRPARINASMRSGVDVEGPRVATILVRRNTGMTVHSRKINESAMVRRLRLHGYHGQHSDP
ncbi:hypothetical protein D3C73_1220100 [compost metagenome]